MIHERVELPAPDRPVEPGLASRKSDTTATGATAVGEVVYRPTAYSDTRGGTRFGGTAALDALPDAVGLRVTTTLGNAYEATLGSAFAVAQSKSFSCNGQPYRRAVFAPVDSAEVLRVPLAFDEFVERVELSPTPDREPSTRGASFSGQIGCWLSLNSGRCDCYDGQGGAVREAAFGVSQTVEGAATAVLATGSGSVRCGRTGRVDVRLVRADGAEGYVAPGESVRLKVRGTLPGTLRFGNATGREITVPYAEARRGGVEYVAPACDGQEGDLEAVIDVYSGNRGNDVVAITVRPEGGDGPGPPGPPQCKSGDECPEPPGPVTMRMLSQTDSLIARPAEGGYLRVSKIRPDWLLPTEDIPFVSPWAPEGLQGSTGVTATRFPNIGRPDESCSDGACHHDPDTYRPQVEDIPPRLVTPGRRFDFRFEVVRAGAVVAESTIGADPRAAAASRSGAAAKSDIFLLRAVRFVRLVSNGRPEEGAASSRERYDDEVAGGQTILVRLGDELRVTAIARATADDPERVLGAVSYPVGDPSGSGVDAIRRVDLAWHTYAGVASAPAVATERVTEDWAQGAVFFHLASERTFTSAELTSVFRIETSRLGAPGSGEVRLSFPNNTPPYAGELVVPFEAGATAREVLNLIVAGIEAAYPDLDVVGRNTDRSGRGSKALVHIGSRAEPVEVAIVSSLQDGGLTIRRRGVPDLDEDRLATGVSEVVRVALRSRSPSLVDILVLPDQALYATNDIRDGVYQGNAVADDGDADGLTANTILLRGVAANGDDALRPVTLGHELGHVLLGSDVLVESPGDSTPCGSPLTTGHTSVDYQIMRCAIGRLSGSGRRGENVDANKRITELNHLQTRCASGSAADDVATACLAALAPMGDTFDRVAPVLLRLPDGTVPARVAPSPPTASNQR